MESTRCYGILGMASIAFGRRLGEFLKDFFPEAQVSARAMCRVDW
jgi:hypothetical protein